MHLHIVEAAELKIIQKYVTKMEDAEKQYSQAGRRLGFGMQR